MAEGDTIARLAERLRPALVGRTIVAAHGRRGVLVSRMVGRRIETVDTVGKNLLFRLEGGLTLRTHLGLDGSWRVGPSAEPSRATWWRADLTIEAGDVVAVCVGARTVELFETRAQALHPALGALGPDIVADHWDAEHAFQRLRSAAGRGIGEAILDQRVVAGIGNVYRSEILFLERVDPEALVGTLPDETLQSILERARELLRSNVQSGAGPRTTTRDARNGRPMAPTRLWVYGRAGRPCHRCGTPIRAAQRGAARPRITYWCPSCQRSAGTAAETTANPARRGVRTLQ
jgi:endonuclease-8